MKTERVGARITPEQKRFIDGLAPTGALAMDRIINEYMGVRMIAFREIAVADIRLDAKDIAVLCDPEMKTAHPSDYINTMYYVAIKHDHLAGAVHSKLDAISPSARYMLSQDSKHLTVEQMIEKYVI